MKRLALAILATLTPISLWAYSPDEVVITGHELPKELQNVGVDEHLGASLDLDLTFTDDKGATGPLRRFFTGTRPVLMAMVYYNCPSLCNYHLNGLTDAMKTLSWRAGQEFEVVAVSMDHTEKADLAGAKKASYVKLYGHPESEPGWHFLVGSKENVAKLSDQLGFKFKWMEDKQQYAHASVTYVITPDGQISRYLHGIQPDPTTLKLSLLEAAKGKIGNVIEQVLMFCFQYNPSKGKFVLYSWNLMRIGAILMVLLLAILLVPLWRREQSNRTRT